MDQRTHINEPLDITAHAIPITFFKNEYATELTTNGMTLPQLLDLIKVTKRKTKGDLPWLKGARFGSKCSPKADGTGDSGCLRWDGNVIGFDMIELDYDKEIMSFDEAVATITEMKVRTLIYTTPTHTKAKPRWRLLLPVSAGTLSLEMRGKLCARINGRFGRIFARESFTLSQSYYYGLALDNPAPEHRCEVIDGRFVDHCADDLFRFEKDGWPSPAGADPGTGTSNANIDWDKVAEHAGWLKNVTDLPLSFNPKGKLIIAHNGNLEDLRFDLVQANLVSKPYKSWSEVSFALTAIFKSDGRIGKNSREVQEALAEVWFHESADLAGMRKVEIESVKAFASRTTDHARPAYAHFLKKQKRHSIEVGTTNSSQYLQSQTGNRRFWPMLVIDRIDIEKLRLDRLELLGEAAHYQSKGESLVLDEQLWPDAGVEQEVRRVDDAWEDVLSGIQPEVTDVYYKNVDGVPTREENQVHITFIIDGKECVAAAALYKHLLGIPISRQTAATSMRLSQVMKKVGWQRRKNGYITIGGKRVKGYYRDLSAAKF